MSTGALMLDLDGTRLDDVEQALLTRPDVGGLILFSRNYESPEQLAELMRQIRDLRPDLLVAVDQEGGRVQRLRDGFTRLPPMAVLGRCWQKDPDEACARAHELGWLMATELRRFDIDFSFAPVLDLDWSRSGVIGDRAFAAQGGVVARLAGDFMAGMHEAGMKATGKHFPGHGWVTADSHLAIPVDERPLSEIETTDMEPFASLIRDGLDAIMPAHVIYSQVCSSPAGFSSYWLREQLRERLGFDGVIFSDDLTMEGASVAGGFPARAERALAADCDMVLVCNHRAGALETLEYLEQSQRPVSPRLSGMRAQPVAAPEPGRLEGARQIARQLCQQEG